MILIRVVVQINNQVTTTALMSGLNQTYGNNVNEQSVRPKDARESSGLCNGCFKRRSVLQNNGCYLFYKNVFRNEGREILMDYHLEKKAKNRRSFGFLRPAEEFGFPFFSCVVLNS